MPLRINNNIIAINTQRHLRLTNSDLTRRIERLASGLRLNRAADDAAGLAISERIRGQVNGFAQGIRNAEQAINLVQTAEGGLNEVNGILIRMRELAVQSASSTISDNNRQSLNSEFSQLSQEIDRIASVTSYNDTTLLTGFGNTISESTTASTVLVSATTGVTGAQVSGATVGTYTFIDTSSADNLVTLGNGTVSQNLWNRIKSGIHKCRFSIRISGSDQFHRFRHQPGFLRAGKPWGDTESADVQHSGQRSGPGEQSGHRICHPGCGFCGRGFQIYARSDPLSIRAGHLRTGQYTGRQGLYPDSIIPLKPLGPQFSRLFLSLLSA